MRPNHTLKLLGRGSRRTKAGISNPTPAMMDRKVANIIGKQSAHRNATRATRPRSAGEMPPSRGGVRTCEPNDNPRNASNPMLSGFCRFDDAPGLSTIDTRDPGWFFPKDNYKPSRLIREQILNIALRLTPIVEPDLTAVAVDV